MSLYKYVTPERIDILSGGRIRFTQASALNDPFELKPQFNTLIGHSELEARVAGQLNIEAAIDAHYGKLPRQYRRTHSLATFKRETLENLQKEGGTQPFVTRAVSDFVDSDLPKLTEMARRELHDVLSNRIGILSLTETAINALMWAHYADDHKGFVIEFDEMNSFFNSKQSAVDEFRHIRPVSYTHESGTVDIITQLDGTKVLCTKGGEWAYEQERRMLIPLDGLTPISVNGDSIYLVEFPPEAIRSIIFGARAGEKLKEDVRKIVAKIDSHSKIQLQQATLVFSDRSIAINPY